MPSANIPEYTIDLSKTAAARWTEVIAKEKAVAGRLVQEAAAEFEKVPEILRRLFARLYQTRGGLYRDEIVAWAEGRSASGTFSRRSLSHLVASGIEWNVLAFF